MPIVLKIILFTVIIITVACKNSNKIKTSMIEDVSYLYELKPSPIGNEILEAEINYLSIPYKAEGKLNFQYEMSLINNYRKTITLKSVEVIDFNNPNTILHTFSKEYLNNNYIDLGLKKSDDETNLKIGMKGILPLMISFTDKNSIPTKVFHRLIFGIPSNDRIVEIPFEVAPIDIRKNDPIQLGLPFNKGKWLCLAESHKNSRYITQGKPSYPQRFAIDWAYIEENGLFLDGDPNKNDSYPTYGQEIFAVADGIVVDIKNTIKDNIPEQIDIKITRETVLGNYIILDIGNEIHAVYAHLIPNSLKVIKGEKVKKGQLIGLLGNSGNSDGPHLHFHLETKSPRILGGEGLPFHFEEFIQLKSFKLDELNMLFQGDRIDLTNCKQELKYNELPMGNGIVEFK